MGGKDGTREPRFKVMHNGEELSLVTRSSDGQLLFLSNMASKMNAKSALGGRIAEVHNGSSLFTGDAGQGESNIRAWIIENDYAHHARRCVVRRLEIDLKRTDQPQVSWLVIDNDAGVSQRPGEVAARQIASVDRDP